MALGIFSWFGYELPLDERLRLIRAAGFAATSLWWGDEETVEARREGPALVHRAGLLLENAHAPFGHARTLWDEDAGVRTAAVDRHREWLEECARQAVPALVAHVTAGSAPPGRLECAVESVGAIVQVAERLGVTLAVENTRRPEAITGVLGAIDSPNLALCYDSSHDRLYGTEPGTIVRVLGERLAAVHLSDNDGEADRHWLPGEGTIDWPVVATALRGARRPDYWMLEAFPKRMPEAEPPEAFLARAYERAEWLAGMIEQDQPAPVRSSGLQPTQGSPGAGSPKGGTQCTSTTT